MSHTHHTISIQVQIPEVRLCKNCNVFSKITKYLNGVSVFLIHISLHISCIITAFFPLQEDTAKELPLFDPYRILSESWKKHNHLVTPVPAAASPAGADTTQPSLSAVFRLAFADETYPYTAAVLMLLLLIVLSLYLL